MAEKNCCCTEDSVFDTILAKHKGTKGALIPILHDIQEHYGYLPAGAREQVAAALKLSAAEVHGVSTFYHHFTLAPKGTYQIAVCLGTACYVKGAGHILQRFREKLGIEVGECTADGLFSLEACRCLGACGLAPVLTVNGKIYGNLKAADVDKIIRNCREGEVKR